MKHTHTPAQIDAFSQGAAAKNAHRITLLVPLVLELAKKAGTHGITVCDLRLVAVQRGLLPEKSTGRDLSFLGAVMRAAKLKATTEVRRSIISGSHANRHTVWVLPPADEQRGAA